MIALIDGDSILYKAGHVGDTVLQWDADNEDSTFVVTDRNVVLNQIDWSIKSILERTGCEAFELYISSSEHSIRKQLVIDYNKVEAVSSIGYKENRTYVRRPTLLEEAKQYVKKRYKAKVTKGIEADDAVVYLKTCKPDEYTLCAIDKDVLYQTEGIHYNYNKKEWVTVSKNEADRYFFYQVLTGDVTDGYKGCEGIGTSKAEKALAEGKTVAEWWAIVQKLYHKKGHTFEYLLLQCRLASMHQWDGKNFNLWTMEKDKAIWK
jgi:DNA polymerase-1